MDIGIVGFGVAGAAAALQLARAGHRVWAFERATTLGPIGAGILLQPSGQFVLAALGLLGEVEPHAHRIAELFVRKQNGRTLLRLPFSDLGADVAAWGVTRTDLFAALHRAAVAAGTRIELGVEIVRRRVDGPRVFLVDANHAEHGPFDFIVAADGSRSALRAGLEAESPESRSWRIRVHAYEYGALWAIGPSTTVQGRLLQGVHGTRQLCGLLPMGHGQQSLFWSLRKRDHAALLERGFDAWRRDVEALCPEAAEVLASLGHFDATRFTHYQHVRVRPWFDAHTVLIGDAAHAMSPHLGQGANLALVDAWTLAGRVAANAGRPPIVAFQEFARRRAVQTRFFAQLTYALTPFFQSDSEVLAWGRNFALPIMQRWPWVRRQMVLSMAGLKAGYLRGRIRW